MKKLFTLVCLGLLVFQSNAQNCTTYPIVKPSWWNVLNGGSGPTSFDLGLTEDSIDVTNDDQIRFTQGQDTSFEIQYLMPVQFDVSDLGVPGVSVVDVSSVTILGVSGLPTGLVWDLDSVGNQNGNSYNPANNRYGAFKICGTTFSPPGIYQVEVQVEGCGSALGISQCEPVPLPLELEVLASPGGNAFFSFSPGSGCDTVNVDFEANVPSPDPVLNPVEYGWDFDNDGAEDATGQFVSATFTNPGPNVVSQSTTFDEFYISQIRLSSIDQSCYQGGLFSEGTGETTDPLFGQCLLGAACNPDVVLNVVTTAGSSSLPEQTDNTSPVWSTDIVVGQGAISITGTELDPPTSLNGNDELGTAVLSINSTPSNGQTYNFTLNNNGTNCASGSLTINRRQQSQTITTDTVFVYQASSTPLISGDTIFCAGDSLALLSSVSEVYQWSDGVSVIGSNQELVVSNPGTYSVTVTDTGTICATTSEVFVVSESIVNPPQIQAGNAGLYIDNPDSSSVQWYSNGLPIPGANGDTLTSLSIGGPFTVEMTNDLGCVGVSDSFEICLPGTSFATDNVVTVGSDVTLEADGFSVTSGNAIAWALSPDGPITSMAELQAAIDAGLVFPGDDDSTLTLSLADFDANGSYYATPFTAEIAVADSVIYAPEVDSGCTPNGQLCISLSGTPGLALVADSLRFTFPDGSSVGLSEIVPPEFQALLPDTIEYELLDLLPVVLPDGLCFGLSDLYNADPNGSWSISVLNVGTGSLTVEVDDINLTVSADSCPLISSDQVTIISGDSYTINPNSSTTIEFEIPPVPASFPTVNAGCETFGDATLISVSGIQSSIDELYGISQFTLSPNPSNGNVNLTFSATYASTASIQLVDVMGRVVYDASQDINNGSNSVGIEFPVLAEGLYYFVLSTDYGRGIHPIQINR